MGQKSKIWGKILIFLSVSTISEKQNVEKSLIVVLQTFFQFCWKLSKNVSNFACTAHIAVNLTVVVAVAVPLEGGHVFVAFKGCCGT